MTVIRVRAVVPPSQISTAAIRSGRIVGGDPWISSQTLINHLSTCGAQLVCANAPNTAISGGNAHTFRYYTWPSAVNTRCTWVVYMTTTNASEDNNPVTIAGAVDFADYRVGYTNNYSGVPASAILSTLAPIVFQENLDASAGPGERSIEIYTDVYNVRVLQILCFETPRDSVELGEGDGMSWRASPGNAIVEVAESGLYGIAAAADALRSNLVRGAFHWYTGTPFTSTSGTFAPLFQLAPRVIMPRMSTADGTTGAIKWAARVSSPTGGTTGELRATAESGATSTFTLAAGVTNTWMTGTLTVDREDLTSSTGGQSGRSLGDAITFELRRTAGAGTVGVSSLGMACSP